jgi:hypothetical protein
LIPNENIEITDTTLLAGKSISSVSFEDALENYAKNTNWWTVFSSFDLPGFSASSLWISQRTNIPVKEVVEALEGLTTLGFLKKENGEFVPIAGKEFIHLDVSRRPKGEVLENHALISSQILNHLQEDGLAAIDHRCFAADDDILNELYADISQAFEKAYANSKHSKGRNRIFKISFTAVDVLPGNQKGKGASL